MEPRQEAVYRRVFTAWYGPLPHPCYFCGEAVTTWGQRRGEGGIHHIDDDFTNNDPTNLAAAHAVCHVSEHSSSRSACPDCGRNYNPTWMTRHVSEGRCTPEGVERLRKRREDEAAYLANPQRAADIAARRSRGNELAYAEGRRSAKGRKKGLVERMTPCPICGEPMRNMNLARHIEGHANAERRAEEARLRRERGRPPRSAESRARSSEAMKRAYAEGRKTRPPGRPKRHD